MTSMTPNKLKMEQLDELSVPRTEWVSRVMRKHEDVLALKERFRPLNGVPTYARVKNSGRTEVKEVLSDDVINMLIMQLFSEAHLDSALQTMQKETGMKFTPGEIETESLQTLLKVGIVTDLKDIFEPLGESEDPDPEVETYRNYVFDSGEDEDTDIWEHKEDLPSNIILNSSNQLVAASLNKLVLWLTNSEKHDMDFRKTFFMTYHSFTTSDRLLSKLIQRYHVPADQTPEQTTRDRVPVVTVIKFWIDHYPGDFTEKLSSALNNFIESTIARDVTDWAKQLRAKMDADSAIPETPGREPPEPKVPKTIFSPKLELDDIDEEEIARQLCLIDFELYAKVRPSEFLLKSWERHKGRAPGVVAVVARYNAVMKWVTTTVLQDRDPTSRTATSSNSSSNSSSVGTPTSFSSKSRAHRVIPRFIRIAEHLRNLNNFLSLSAIYAGLTSSAVHQHFKSLTMTLSTQQHNILHELEKLLSPESNYKNYRAAYSAARPPCIPLIGVHLRDISFTEDCNPDEMQGLINFEKRQQLWRVISAYLSYQPIPYNYHKVHQIMVFLQDLKVEHGSSALSKLDLL